MRQTFLSPAASRAAAARQGNVLVSRLIHRAHAEAGWFLYAPACALVEADRAG
ncbi:hypothetical protein ACIHCQ_35955 [Streptomyces sp. NPDC052236]|uniref:hypothetical protein n=1 Tax=Streptomyces sp. NPDC052236 TaxID=3365686 RepID=UPI0037D818C3